MGIVTCPLCGAENPVGSERCTQCRVNLKLALHDPDEIERVKAESVTVHAAMRDGPEPRSTAGFNPLALWALWTGATTVGLAVGSLPLAALVALLPGRLWLGILLLPVAGACMGTAQWLVLRRRIALSAGWILESAVRIVIEPFLLVITQWVPGPESMMEKHLRSARPWRLSTSLAWLVALFGPGLFFLARLFRKGCFFVGVVDLDCGRVTTIGWWFQTVELTAILAGLIVGTVTGTALVSLLDEEGAAL